MSAEFICKNCGNDCHKNRVGFLFSNNEIQFCAACTDILSMSQQLEFDFAEVKSDGTNTPLDI